MDAPDHRAIDSGDKQSLTVTSGPKDIADAAGHVNPNVTRAVYRHQISGTVTRAPAALDQALAAGGEQA